MKKNINRIAFFNFLSVLLLQGISLISAPLFSRLLGTAGYGDLSSFNVWVTMVMTVLSLQSHVTVVNARQDFPEQEQAAYQSSVMSLSLLSFALGSGLLLALSGPISAALNISRLLLALVLVEAFGQFCVNFLSNKFTYEFKADRNMLLSVLIAVANLGVSLLLVLNMPAQQRYFGRILGNVLVYGVVGLAGCLWILRRGKRRYSPRYWKFCLVIGVPLIFQNLAYSVLGSSDVLMLKQIAGATQSGIYSYAFTLAGVMYTLYSALNTSWVPFFFDDMKQNRREDVVRRGRNYLELYTVLSMGFVLLVREVFRVYADADFWPGVGLIPLFVANYFGNVLCTFPVNYEILHKKTTVVAAATVTAAVANVALNYFLIHMLGMVGAAVATLLARILQLGIHLWYTHRILGREDYPFAFRDNLLSSAALAGDIGLFSLTPDAWYLRWPLGAVLGLWELRRIWKRRSLL